MGRGYCHVHYCDCERFELPAFTVGAVDLDLSVDDGADIQTGLPPLPEVSGSGYSRKPIPASAFRGDEARWWPFWDDVWDEQVAAQFERVVAFRAFRVRLERQAMDPYREGPFDRVWCSTERRAPFTKFGLQFDGKTVEGSLHHDAGFGSRPTRAGWAEAVDFLLDELATRLFPDPEPPFLPGGGEQTPEARRAAIAGAFPHFRD